ncbi:stage II sporulation protein M [Candidatus Poribacteria bacterium]|nr:stage II sporulation protein M [Candidatus Poribacteria bacterium]
MTVTDFVQKKQPVWNELENLLDKKQYVAANDLNRLGYLYRRITSDLAVARRDFPQDRCVTYLNELASRAHSKVYQSSPFKRGSLWGFLRNGFPKVIRENIIFVAIAFVMFGVAFAGAYWSALRTPELTEDLIPERVVSHIKELGAAEWNATDAEHRNIFASEVMTNNIRVAFLAFAWGILFMVGSVYILIYNGIIIGSIGGLCQVHGVSLALWSFASPHGYIELTMIFIAGGAGMRLGYALISPTVLTRKRTLINAARTAIQMLGGCVILLILAGIIEGFISPSNLPNGFKIAFGAITGVLLFIYLFVLKPKSNPV